MKISSVLLGTFLTLNLSACSTPQQKKDEAEAEYTSEKTQTLQEYKACVNASEGAPAKMAQCEALLKAVGAVEGNAVISAPAVTPAPVENSQPAEAAGTTAK